MRSATLAVVAVTASLSLALACGGSAPPAQAPLPAGAPQAGDAGAPPPAGDAGPTSTTTQTLGGGVAGGTKLTPLAAAAPDPSGAVTPPKHHGEVGRTIADLQAIVASHRDEARACYDTALAAHPGIEGSIDIRWTIDPAGAVSDADVDTSHSEIVEPSVGNCIIAIVKKIHFNASAKGFETKAHYPFNFHPHARHVVNTPQ